MKKANILSLDSNPRPCDPRSTILASLFRHSLRPGIVADHDFPACDSSSEISTNSLLNERAAQNRKAHLKEHSINKIIYWSLLEGLSPIFYTLVLVEHRFRTRAQGPIR